MKVGKKYWCLEHSVFDDDPVFHSSQPAYPWQGTLVKLHDGRGHLENDDKEALVVEREIFSSRKDAFREYIRRMQEEVHDLNMMIAKATSDMDVIK